MSADEGRVRDQLMIIEHVYGIKLTGRDGLAEQIAAAAADDREALRMTTAVNTWAAARLTSREITVPADALQELVRRVKGQGA